MIQFLLTNKKIEFESLLASEVDTEEMIERLLISNKPKLKEVVERLLTSKNSIIKIEKLFNSNLEIQKMGIEYLLFAKEKPDERLVELLSIQMKEPFRKILEYIELEKKKKADQTLSEQCSC